MLTLSIETSSPHGSLCLANMSDSSFDILEYKEWTKQKSHSEVITLHLQELLNTAKKELSMIQQICVGIGPGSFTGLRVALNCAKTLAYSLNLPLNPYSSLEVLAQKNKNHDRPTLVLVNAFKNFVYVAAYHKEQVLVEPQAATAQELSQLIQGAHYVLGDGWNLMKEYISAELKAQLTPIDLPPFPHACDLARRHFMIKTPPCPWAEVTPLYIKPSAAEEKLHAGLLKPITRRNIN